MSQDWSKYQEGDPPDPSSQESETIISPDTRRENRLPPGQVRTRKWPILHWKRVATVAESGWTLFVRGLVERPLTITHGEFVALPRVRVFADFHCVTRWSRLGNVWEGVSTREIMKRAGVHASANYVIAHGSDDGFTTNMPIGAFSAEDALLCDIHDGERISADHGGPVRLIVPQLYAWKSAKWLSGLEFVSRDSPGYWERNGYHAHGDPWREQRYSW